MCNHSSPCSYCAFTMATQCYVLLTLPEGHPHNQIQHNKKRKCSHTEPIFFSWNVENTEHKLTQSTLTVQYLSVLNNIVAIGVEHPLKGQFPYSLPGCSHKMLGNFAACSVQQKKKKRCHNNTNRAQWLTTTPRGSLPLLK
jgi:hypothetical protein